MNRFGKKIILILILLPVELLGLFLLLSTYVSPKEFVTNYVSTHIYQNEKYLVKNEDQQKIKQAKGRFISEEKSLLNISKNNKNDRSVENLYNTILKNIQKKAKFKVEVLDETKTYAKVAVKIQGLDQAAYRRNIKGDTEAIEKAFFEKHGVPFFQNELGLSEYLQGNMKNDQALQKYSQKVTLNVLNDLILEGKIKTINGVSATKEINTITIELRKSGTFARGWSINNEDWQLQQLYDAFGFML